VVDACRKIYNEEQTGMILNITVTERFFSSLLIFPPSHEFFSLSVFPPSHQGVLAITQHFLLLKIWLSSHKTHCWLYYLAKLSLHNCLIFIQLGLHKRKLWYDFSSYVGRTELDI